jgi:hypothetical protein
MVESGNGRVIALRQIKENHPDLWEKYQVALKEKAESLGIDPADLKGIEDPVLVRERTHPMTAEERVAFAEEANAPDVAQKTATEKAVNDRQRIPDAGLAEIFIPEDAKPEDIVKAQANYNKIVKPFIDSLSANEKTELMYGKGDLNQEGVRRLVNALFSKAYGDTGTPVLDNLIGATDLEGAKNLQNGLFQTIGDVAKLNAEVEAGVIPKSLGAADNIMAATNRFIGLRRDGVYIQEWVRQTEIFDQVPDVEKQWIESFATAKSKQQVVEMIREYVKLASDYRSSVLEGAVPKQAELVELARENALEAAAKRKKPQRDMFEPPEPPTEPGGGVGKGRQRGAVSLPIVDKIGVFADNFAQRMNETSKMIGGTRIAEGYKNTLAEALGNPLDRLRRLGSAGDEIATNIAQVFSKSGNYFETLASEYERGLKTAQRMAARAGKSKEFYQAIGRRKGGEKLVFMIQRGDPLPAYLKPVAKAWRDVIEYLGAEGEKHGVLVARTVGDHPIQPLNGKTIRYLDQATQTMKTGVVQKTRFSDGNINVTMADRFKVYDPGDQSSVTFKSIKDAEAYADKNPGSLVFDMAEEQRKELVLRDGTVLAAGTKIWHPSLVNTERFVNRVIKPEIWDELRREFKAGSGPLTDQWVQDLVQNHDLTEAAARQAILKWKNEYDEILTTPSYTALRRPRVGMILPEAFYETDFSKLAIRHINNSAYNIAWSRHFGPGDEFLAEMLQGMDRQDQTIALRQIEKINGASRKEYPTLSNAAAVEGVWQAGTKLSGFYTWARQISQFSSGAGVHGLAPTMKAYSLLAKEFVRGRKAWSRFTSESGAIPQDYFKYATLEDAQGAMKSVASVVTFPMKVMDSAFRKPAALAGYMRFTKPSGMLY